MYTHHAIPVQNYSTFGTAQLYIFFAGGLAGMGEELDHLPDGNIRLRYQLMRRYLSWRKLCAHVAFQLHLSTVTGKAVTGGAWYVIFNLCEGFRGCKSAFLYAFFFLHWINHLQYCTSPSPPHCLAFKLLNPNAVPESSLPYARA